ncbi:hypothetical protein F2Q65_10470 [Thiohalocapsa marina]|uniref:Uncharacterized protein n=1 Tax=Thiohalocapsa marina TaxID=424902 RepID=A0A5M8FQU6_9GAMM|nr:hypothetical protein [Thiohalocapsa marina]KAA6184955.1 hypothetical protein F2Q65_10470 [Thiohalocapsa marina]
MKSDPKTPGLSVDVAFNRVLAAEQAAREAVASCRQAAADRIARAEQDVRAIGARADARIRRAHAVADRGIACALAQLRQPGSDAADPEASPADAPPQAELVQRLVTALARELTEPPA